jgi:hypothetical protein
MPVWMAQRAPARNAQLTTLGQTLTVAEAELNGLHKQAVQIKSQLEIRRGFHQKLMRLKKDGLVPEERALEQQARLSELNEEAQVESPMAAEQHPCPCG